MLILSINLILSFIFSFLVSLRADAQALSPHKGLSFQAVIKNSNGQKLNATSASIKAQILTGSSDCVLREETHTNIKIQDGYFSLVIGGPTAIIGGGYNPSPLLSLVQIFDNSQTFSGLTCVNADNSVNLTGQSFVPTSSSRRKLRLRLTVPGEGQVIVADFNFRAVGFALNSESLNGKRDTDFLTINNAQNVTQANIESLFLQFTKLNTILSGANTNGSIPVQNLALDGSGTPFLNNDGNTFLSGDGTWKTVAGGGGAVTSVATRTGAVVLASADITDATASNTASKLVLRDPSGNFAAGAITATSLGANSVTATGAIAGGSLSATTSITGATVTGTTVSGGTGQFTNLKVYDGTANYLTQTAPVGGFGGAGYTIQWPTTAGTANQVLQINSVAGDVATLGWVTPSTPTSSQWNDGASNSINYTTGNVGIGTTTPNSALSVQGAINVSYPATGSLIFGDTSGNARGSGAMDIQVSRSAGTQVATGNGAIVVGRDNTGFGLNGVTLGLGSNANGNNSVAIGNNAQAGGDGGVALGINVTAPTNGVSIGRGVNNATTNSLQIGPSDSAKLTILSSGNLGVGTTTPSEKIDVNGAIKLGSTTNTNAGTIRWDGIHFQGYNGSDWVNFVPNPATSGSCDSTVTYSVAGTYSYTVPASFGTITIQMWGGGGGGGGASGAVTVGGTGGTSSIASLGLTAFGGSGGGGATSASNGAGGAGGSASGGTINTPGNAGAGATGGSSGTGGTAPNGGAGGPARSGNIAGASGASPGGGGSGGSYGGNTAFAGGGGSGSYLSKTFTTATLNPSSILSGIVVGAGGSSGLSGTFTYGGTGGAGQVTITCVTAGAPPINDRAVLFSDAGQYSTSSNFVYTASGNVGIGTTSPAYKLDVAGDVNVTGNFKVNGTNITAGGLTSVSGSTLSEGRIWVGNASSQATEVIPSSDLIMDNAGAFTVTKLRGRTLASTAPNLGALLKWNNTLLQWEPFYWPDCNGVSQVLHFTAVSDTWACDTISLSSATGTLPLANGGTGATDQSGAANAILPTQASNSGKYLTTNGSTVSWETVPGDNLGNHTATQALQMAGFTINGNSTASGTLTLDSTSDATKGNILLNPTNGNVGIGTASPVYKLQVNGTVYGSSAKFGNATFTTPDLTSIFIGYFSGFSGSTSGGNTALGKWTMMNVGTGYNNTAIGDMALSSVTTGNFNTAVGESALSDNLAGSSNTAVGNGALLHTTGSKNIGLGEYAGSAITSGSNNVVIGSSSASSIATSSNNIIISDGAGNERIRVNSSGNVGIGNTSPTTKLDVTGTIKSSTGVVTSSIGSASGSLRMYSNNASNGGYVYIEPTASRLEVYAVGSSNGIVESLRVANDYQGAGANGIGSSISLRSVDSNRDYAEGGSVTAVLDDANWVSLDGSLRFATLGPNASSLTASEKMRIDSAGNVGIGTTSPAYKLDVAGDVNVTGNFKVNGTNLTTGSGTVNSGTANQMAYYSASGAAVSGNASATLSSGALTLGQAGSVLGSLNLSGNTSGVVSVNPQAAAGTYNFNLPTTAGTAGQPLLSAGGGTSPMTWSTVSLSGGNVTVPAAGGITNASGEMTVSANTNLTLASNTGGITTVGNTNTTSTTVINGGGLGGGITLAPGTLGIGVSGWTTAGVVTNSASGVLSSTESLPISLGGTNNSSLGVTNGGVLYTDGTKVMNMGVGTAGQVLQSNGAAAPGWVNTQWNNGASNSINYMAGYVGIGTTSPSANLEINGSSGSTLKIVDGNQAAGRVLTSDASGQASWAAASGAFAGAVNISTTPYSITSSDNGKAFYYTNNANGVINLPTLSGVNDGFSVTISRDVAKTLTITPNGSDRFPGGVATVEMLGKNLQALTIMKLGSTWKLVNQTEECTVGQDCWTADTTGGMKQLYVGTYKGHQYFTTPGGCTNSSTPTCAGGTDNNTYVWSSAATTSGTTAGNTATVLGTITENSYSDAKVACSTCGATGMAEYLGTAFTDTAAARYCANMNYAGYTDWYLPSREELSFLYRNSQNIGGFVYSSFYWSSTEFTTTGAWTFTFYNAYNSFAGKTNPYYARCVRRF